MGRVGPMKASPTCIACSIFRREIEALQAAGALAASVRYLSSMLHMVPEQLEAQLRRILEAERAQGHEVVLGFGDCCAHMLELQSSPGATRTEGINCCEIILGRERYRQLRKEGAFFFLPEWAHCWRRIFEHELGLSCENAQSLMRDMHTRLVYLDTGLVPVPEQEMREASEFTGLPWEILPVDLEALRSSLERALHLGKSDG